MERLDEALIKIIAFRELDLRREIEVDKEYDIRDGIYGVGGQYHNLPRH